MSQTITLPSRERRYRGPAALLLRDWSPPTPARCSNIDTFNQPGVEESKVAAYAVMGYDSEIHTAKREEMRACPEGKPEYVF